MKNWCSVSCLSFYITTVSKQEGRNKDATCYVTFEQTVSKVTSDGGSRHQIVGAPGFGTVSGETLTTVELAIVVLLRRTLALDSTTLTCNISMANCLVRRQLRSASSQLEHCRASSFVLPLHSMSTSPARKSVQRQRGPVRRLWPRIVVVLLCCNIHQHGPSLTYLPAQ